MSRFHNSRQPAKEVVMGRDSPTRVPHMNDKRDLQMDVTLALQIEQIEEEASYLLENNGITEALGLFTHCMRIIAISPANMDYRYKSAVCST